MNASHSLNRLATIFGVAAILSLGTSLAALAYDGQHCTQPGVCWQPQPGYPERLAGSKYDTSTLVVPSEVAKQGNSERAMEQRNQKRVDYFKRTGKFIYDVSQIPD
jgi:methanol dehydrogenase (cytochrome c) subunit 2